MNLKTQWKQAIRACLKKEDKVCNIWNIQLRRPFFAWSAKVGYKLSWDTSQFFLSCNYFAAIHFSQKKGTFHLSNSGHMQITTMFFERNTCDEERLTEHEKNFKLITIFFKRLFLTLCLHFINLFFSSLSARIVVLSKI